MHLWRTFWIPSLKLLWWIDGLFRSFCSVSCRHISASLHSIWLWYIETHLFSMCHISNACRLWWWMSQIFRYSEVANWGKSNTAINDGISDKRFPQNGVKNLKRLFPGDTRVDGWLTFILLWEQKTNNYGNNIIGVIYKCDLQQSWNISPRNVKAEQHVRSLHLPYNNTETPPPRLHWLLTVPSHWNWPPRPAGTSGAQPA